MVVLDGGHASGHVLDTRCCSRWARCDHPHRITSAAAVFFLGCFLVYASIGLLYFSVFVYKQPNALTGSPGCQEDSEGSWAIGVFFGDSPFSLNPIENMNVWRKDVAAWPVSNPVLTCASASVDGNPSNFVADPFLYLQGEDYYLFYETKNSITNQGDIGVAKSTDKGATWRAIGVALDEEWHLSYPYVFTYNGEVYMMPESSTINELWLYKAVEFPLKWKKERVLIKKPLIDAVMIHHDGVYWVLGSDHSGFGARKNGELEIWYSDSPLGEFKRHKKNPIHNGDKRTGARNGGRPFVYDGSLYRVGQDSGETYGRRTRVFKIVTLTKDEYKEEEVKLGFVEPKKGINSWNGARHHHLDAQRLNNGSWIAVMDGDRVPSGDSVRRLMIGWLTLAGAGLSALSVGLLINAVRVPSVKRARRLNRAVNSLRTKVRFRRVLVGVLFLTGAILMCKSVGHVYGGDGAEPPYPVNGTVSQFTLLTMTYEARVWNLKMYIKHYSRCTSVKEIVIVWNKGTPPSPDSFDSAVPVRVRRERRNSLNNRFNKDELITTRAVLELDDDIMMTCDDVERGFSVWRRHPDRLVGFYPRLVGGRRVEYRAEGYAREENAYNVILTGAAFMDGEYAFGVYGGERARGGREWVEESFNCEDVLMNYLYANGSAGRTVEYVRPRWAIDTSKVSGAAISKDTRAHYRVRSRCLRVFEGMYGSLVGRKWGFGSRGDGWDL